MFLMKVGRRGFVCICLALVLLNRYSSGQSSVSVHDCRTTGCSNAGTCWNSAIRDPDESQYTHTLALRHPEQSHNTWDAASQNSGKARNSRNSAVRHPVESRNSNWKCSCPKPYAGPHCEYLNPCLAVPHPCTPGRFDHCVFSLSVAHHYLCICRAPYSGQRCEIISRSRRQAQPFVNCSGVLIELQEGGYSPLRKKRSRWNTLEIPTRNGLLRRRKRQKALKPCKNGGFCEPKYVSDIAVDYTCLCREGWTGRGCQERDCPSGLHGKKCQQECPVTCRDRECWENGNCFECVPGHSGLRCDVITGLVANVITVFTGNVTQDLENEQSEEYAMFRDDVTEWVLLACDDLKRSCFVSPYMLFSSGSILAEYTVIFDLQGDTNESVVSNLLIKQLADNEMMFESNSTNSSVIADSIAISAINNVWSGDFFSPEEEDVKQNFVKISVICGVILIVGMALSVIAWIAFERRHITIRKQSVARISVK